MTLKESPRFSYYTAFIKTETLGWFTPKLEVDKIMDDIARQRDELTTWVRHAKAEAKKWWKLRTQASAGEDECQRDTKRRTRAHKRVSGTRNRRNQGRLRAT